MAGLGFDLRNALRNTIRDWPLSLAFLSVMALIVGASTAIFGVVDAILLRALPYAEAERIVALREVTPEPGRPQSTVSPASLVHWRKHSRAFAAVEGFYSGGQGLVLTSEGEDLWLSSAAVTPGYFALLGTPPVLGRGFSVEETGLSVLISDRLWQERFGRDPDIVGRRVRLDGRPREVVGVLPASLRFPLPADVWTRMSFQHHIGRRERGSRYLGVVARLSTGAGLVEAQADLEIMSRRLAAEFPDTHGGWGATVESLSETLIADVRPRLLSLSIAGAVLVILGCANLAHQLLAKGMGRSQEVAIRAALGASRRRIVGSLLMESLLLSLVAGVFGFGLAMLTIRLLGILAPAELVPHLHLAWRGGAFTLGLVILAGLVTALVPARKIAGEDAARLLRESGRSSGLGRLRLGRLMSAGQVALAVILLVGCGLLLRSFLNLVDADLGFEVEGVFTADARLLGRTDSEREEQANRLLASLVDSLSIRQAALTGSLPMTGPRMTERIALGDEGASSSVKVNVVSPGYFGVMQIPLARGRPFSPSDRPEASQVAIVNETLARRFWPRGDALARKLSLDLDGREREIVAIARDTRSTAIGTPPEPEIYLPYAQRPLPFVALLLRPGASETVSEQDLRRRLKSVDSRLIVYHLSPLSSVMEPQMLPRQFLLRLFVGFGVVSTLLALISVHAVASLSARQRLLEIGIRLALGAHRRNILNAVLAQTVLAAAGGATAGLLAASVLSNLLKSQLYGVQPIDGLTFALVTVGIIGAASIAALGPACRAAATDPAAVLGSE